MRGLLLSLLAVFAILDQFCDSCPRDQFICHPTNCIYDSWICDGKRDCSNGKDEESCGNGCPHLSYRCSNGSCIHNSKICDRHPDCTDGSDEENCGKECFSVEFTCANGQCIAGHKLRCDGKFDCTDGSDEQGCDTHKCSQDEFTCSSGNCIKNIWVCDGDKDCRDGSDEKNCPLVTTCSSKEVTCTDGSCGSSYISCFFNISGSNGSDEDITAESVSSNTANTQDDKQQCLLGQGCLIKVMAVVFGILVTLTLFFCGSFCLRYRNKVRAGESQYLPLSRQRESGTANEAFTMDSVP